MQVVYFAHDLTDPAVAKRVQMLRAAGATLRLAGFYRGPSAVDNVDGVDAVSIGQTVDGRLLARAALVFRRALGARKLRSLVAGADVLLARNLEMCIVAQAARTAMGLNASLVYECLDIHKAVQGNDLVAMILREVERQVLRWSSALVLSSPAYVSEYYQRFAAKQLPRVIVSENKRFAPEVPRTKVRRRPGPRWRIGWFAKCQCTWSFTLLLKLARRVPDLVEVEIRGTPTAAVMKLIQEHLPLPNFQFKGPYTQAQLGTIYQAVHFAWSIDFNGGDQSYWLLPNRLYESSFYNVPVIAAAHTEISRWLRKRGAGLIIDGWLGPIVQEQERAVQWLADYFSALSPSAYEDLVSATIAIPDSDLTWFVPDCRAFLAAIST